jgi:uncharacterized membrane protein
MPDVPSDEPPGVTASPAPDRAPATDPAAATEAELLAFEHDHEQTHEVDHELERAAHAAMKVRLARLELLAGLGHTAAGTAAHHLPAWLRKTRGETRIGVVIAVLVVIGLQWAIPDYLALKPRWLLPVVAGLLFVILSIGNPTRITRESKLLRLAALLLALVLSLAVAYSVVRLVWRLVHPGGAGSLTAGQLLLDGGVIWLTNVIVFALWYWEFDRGGPAARAVARKPHPDFLFSQMTAPELVDRDWEPGFVDYLYLSFTNATAFSPTDTLPMSRWAKLAMMFQSAISLITVALVVSRAVNIFT